MFVIMTSLNCGPVPIPIHMCCYIDGVESRLSSLCIPSRWRVESTRFGGKGTNLFLTDVDPGVAGIRISDQWPGSGETLCVLVENDVALIFDELALLVDTVNFRPSSVASL